MFLIFHILALGSEFLGHMVDLFLILCDSSIASGLGFIFSRVLLGDILEAAYHYSEYIYKCV